MSQTALKIAILSGEASGDLLGAQLVAGLQQQLNRPLQLAGIGGDKMRAAGVECWHHYEQLALFGLIEVLRHVPRLYRLRQQLIQQLIDWQPALVISIDAPDFFLPLAKRLKNHGVRCIHYVCPSVWAWRQGRVKNLRLAVEHVLCLLPFEQQFLAEHSVDASFVGHPLVSQIPPITTEQHQALADKFELASVETIIALLPGSRNSELQRHAELFIQTAIELQQTHSQPIQFVSATTRAEHQDVLQTLADRYSLQLVFVDNAQQACQLADAALLASGTVALEAMLCHTPMVVAYQLSPLTWQIMSKLGLYKAAYIALPNLLAKKRLVPEFLQHQATPKTLSSELARLLSTDQSQLRQDFSALAQQLQANSDKDATAVVIQLLEEGR